MRKSNRGVFFSMDALIAVVVIFLTLLVVVPVVNHAYSKTEIHSDTMKVISSLKIGEVQDPYIQSLISSNVITELNKSVLEQIGEFYITDPTLAKNIGLSILSKLNTNKNIGIWYGDDLIASKNSTSYEDAINVEAERQIVSGLKQGADVTGYVSRAYLSSDTQTRYFYFGGYVGDGNISAQIDYDGNLTLAQMELAINNNFSVFVNGFAAGNYARSDSDFSPRIYTLPTTHFSSGTNLITINGNNLHIAGGLIKLVYRGSPSTSQRYNFPGIEGTVNLYDGFYSGNLQSMNVSLHVKSNYTLFMTIGNVTVYRNKSVQESTINLTDAYLSSVLNYASLSGKTIPFRLGLENVSYTSYGTLNSDVYSVTDLSGSMADTSRCSVTTGTCCNNHNHCNNQARCLACGWTWVTIPKLGNAKSANNAFVDGVLNFSGNRVGLVGYRDSVLNGDTLSLTTNNISLKSEIASWTANGNTCICCGINNATRRLIAESNSSRIRSMVVMSDGQANVRCAQQGTGSAINDAIEAACDAYQNYGITVYAVGFGADADESTLQRMAACGNGTYYYSDIDDIVDLYKIISQDIIKASYNEQTINVSPNFATTRLYPDSFIDFNSNAQPNYYGMVLNLENDFDNSSSGSFNVPSDSIFLDGRVISYSGPRWTSYAGINNYPVYNLSQFGGDYNLLGDPYSIELPHNVQNNNTVRVDTGLSPTNSSTGSNHNKIIYRISKNSSSYSPILPYTRGCNWTIEFEDNSNLSINIPSNYPGSNTCAYTPTERRYDSNDAAEVATFELLKILDLDSDNKVDTKFSEQNMQIVPNAITGIPYTWSTEVQVRVWE